MALALTMPAPREPVPLSRRREERPLSERMALLERDVDETERRVDKSEATHAELWARIDKLESWRDEAEGGIGLIRYAIAVTGLSGIVGLITLILIVTGHKP